MKVLETFDNRSYEITDEQHEKIMEQSMSGQVKSIWIGKDYIAFGSIKAIHETSRGYGQPYTDFKSLPGKGFVGLIGEAKATDHIQALLRGLKKAKYGLEKTPNTDSLISRAEKGTKTMDGKINAKYETWEEAQKAGVV